MSGWQDQAACKDAPGDAFFPNRIRREVRVSQAIDMCQGCDVFRECATEGMRLASGAGVCGVWGGVDLGETPVTKGKRVEALKAVAEGSDPEVRRRGNGGRCASCKRPTRSRNDTETVGVRYGAKGLCAACYQRRFRQEVSA